MRKVKSVRFAYSVKLKVKEITYMDSLEGYSATFDMDSQILHIKSHDDHVIVFPTNIAYLSLEHIDEEKSKESTPKTKNSSKKAKL